MESIISSFLAVMGRDSFYVGSGLFFFLHDFFLTEVWIFFSKRISFLIIFSSDVVLDPDCLIRMISRLTSCLSAHMALGKSDSIFLTLFIIVNLFVVSESFYRKFVLN